MLELVYNFTLFQTCASLLGCFGCFFFALVLAVEDHPVTIPAKVEKFVFNLRFGKIERIGKLSYKQAIARRNFLNAAKNRKSQWLAIVHIIGGNKKEFLVIRESQFDTFRRVFSIDNSDKIEVI